MSESWYVLGLSDSTEPDGWLHTIDSLLLRILDTGDGVDPNGLVGSPVPGVLCWVKDTGAMWICSFSDGTGSADGASTIWQVTTIIVSPATTTTYGAVKLSTLTDAQTGVSGKVLTTDIAPQVFAKLGANHDITSLSAVTTPLTLAQGGVGQALAHLADLLTLLFPSATGNTGKFLACTGVDGNGNVTITWANPGAEGLSLVASGSTFNLTSNTRTFVTIDNCNLMLPTSPGPGDKCLISFRGGFTGNKISPPTGTKIETLVTDGLNVNIPNINLTLQYINSSTGWAIVAP